MSTLVNKTSKLYYIVICPFVTGCILSESLKYFNKKVKQKGLSQSYLPIHQLMNNFVNFC